MDSTNQGQEGALGGQPPNQNPNNQGAMGPAPEHKPGTITIGGPSKPKPQAQGAAPSAGMNEMIAEVRTYATRIRSVEERINNLRRSFQLNEQNVLDVNKKVNEELSTMSSDILDLKREISGIKNKMELIIKELMLTAKKEDVDVINKYLDLWKPVDFVTHNEVRKIVKQLLYEIGLNVDVSQVNQTTEESSPEHKEMSAHLRPSRPEEKEEPEPLEENPVAKAVAEAQEDKDSKAIDEKSEKKEKDTSDEKKVP
jgi:hypothetical protein